jgi:hypothetical protein
MASAELWALPPPFSPGVPQFAPHPSNGDRGDGADMLSLGKTSEGLLRLSLGRRLHRSCPLTTGVIAGVGRSGAGLSDALRVASRKSMLYPPAWLGPPKCE